MQSLRIVRAPVSPEDDPRHIPVCLGLGKRCVHMAGSFRPEQKGGKMERCRRLPCSVWGIVVLMRSLCFQPGLSGMDDKADNSSVAHLPCSPIKSLNNSVSLIKKNGGALAEWPCVWRDCRRQAWRILGATIHRAAILEETGRDAREQWMSGSIRQSHMVLRIS
ncbi:hypothetical protein Bbelb_151300 [Branchiostoma belcheri]|nr:hypothetical protein Bbelb_151300 [Branchiostoma belcheri]